MKINIVVNGRKIVSLFNIESKANLISKKFVKKENFVWVENNVTAKTIGGKVLNTYKVHFFDVEVNNRNGHTCYFCKSFLATNFAEDIKVVLGMP